MMICYIIHDQSIVHQDIFRWRFSSKFKSDVSIETLKSNIQQYEWIFVVHTAA